MGIVTHIGLNPAAIRAIVPKRLKNRFRCDLDRPRTARNTRQIEAAHVKFISILIMLGLLAGCSGSSRSKGGTDYSTITRVSSGPISRACLSSDRKARSRQLCGCIQAAADRTLSNSDQKLAASFYNNPQKAQDIRQSDRSAHEVFWKKYRNFSETAEAICNI